MEVSPPKGPMAQIEARNRNVEPIVRLRQLPMPINIEAKVSSSTLRGDCIVGPFPPFSFGWELKDSWAILRPSIMDLDLWIREKDGCSPLIICDKEKEKEITKETTKAKVRKEGACTNKKRSWGTYAIGKVSAPVTFHLGIAET